MFLSKLKINGFKSFPSKTELKFSKGMTCIIGPNGCGKSNIVDSIRWVIGEQRAGAIRSDKMTDVIFNGAEKKKPLGMAEVELTIVNDRGVLSSEYTDVVITRRVFRSGQSEYLLNGAQCRLKDIQSLFTDKGMGSGAYSVIELKMVEQILSNSNTDRRLLFEEAAGIKKYKQHRTSAQRKLNDTQQDLLRVNDIIEEVKKTVNSLSRQVAKVNRYRALKEELKQLEIGVATTNYFNLLKEIDPLEEKLKNLKETDLESGKQLSIDENLIENLKLDQIRLEDELSKSRQQIFAQDEKIRKIKEEELLSAEKLKNSAELIERLEFEIEKITHRKKSAEDLIKEKRSQLEEVQRSLETFDETYEGAEEEFQELTAHYLKHKTDLESTTNKLRILQTDVNRLNNEIDQLKFQKSELEKRKASLTVFDKGLIESIQTEIKTVQADQLQLNTKLVSKEAEFSELIKKQEIEKQKLDAVSLKKKEEEKAYLQLESKRNLLEDSLHSGNLHPDDIKQFLDESYEFESFVGLLSEVISVKEGEDEALIGTLLQSYASLPVFKGITSKEQNLLKETYSGLKCFVLPETFDVPELHEYSFAYKIESSFLSDADIRYLFGNWVLLPDLSKLNSFISRGYTVISSEAFFNSGDRLFQFIRRSDNGINLIGAEKQIERLDDELEIIQEKLDQYEEEVFEIEDRTHSYRELQGSIQADIQHLKDENRGFQSKIQELEFKQTHYEDQFANSEKEVRVLDQKITILTDDISEKLPRFEGLAHEESDLEERQKILQLDVDQYLTKQERAKDQLNELKIERNKLESDETALKDVLRREYYFLKDSDTEIEKKKQEIESLKNLKTNVDTQSVSRKEDLETLENEKDTLLNNKAAVEDQYITVKDSIQKIETELKETRARKEKMLDQKQQLELKIQELYVKSQTILENISKQYEVQVTEIEPPTEFNILQAEKEIFDIRGKLNALGEVNSLAIEEYAKEKERYDFLDEQRNDILDAEKMLSETIEKINKTAQEQFNSVFQEIRTNFQRVFGEFFKNGEADIQLHQAEDPLEGKIEINVRPKGRALQTLALMSGGEKTLTAISLLFAIYLVKPSPFCILDEVDAPLDDVNIRRFTDALQTFTDHTQFIIVTHNQRTMEAADYMYGVTQEHVGISKLVSVKFN